jgi:hypothetical protein
MVNAVLTRRPPPRPRRDGSADTLLVGKKRGDWRAHPETARKLALELARRDEVANWVTPTGSGSAADRAAERRGGARERMRLRSAKLLDAAYRFVCECRICDRSVNGLRLALPRNIGLPPRVWVHIDETSEVRNARVVWRRGPVIGVRLHERAPAGALRPSDRFALRERYYAILD